MMGMIVIIAFSVVLVGSVTAFIATRRRAADRRSELSDELVEQLAATHKNAAARE